MKQLAWPWPSSYKWKYIVEQHEGRFYISDTIVNWAGEPTGSPVLVLDVGAESLQDLKEALGLMMKCVDKRIDKESK